MENISAASVLNEQIAKSASRQPEEDRSARVVFNSGMFRGPRREELVKTLERINSALAASNEEERLRLATELLKLWLRGADEEVREVLGDFAEKRLHRGQVMCTLTGNNRQLRMWYSFPGRIEYDHVDSCGTGLLFGVYGYPDVVLRYLHAFLSVADLAEAHGKNGVRIFVGY